MAVVTLSSEVGIWPDIMPFVVPFISEHGGAVQAMQVTRDEVLE